MMCFLVMDFRIVVSNLHRLKRLSRIDDDRALEVERSMVVETSGCSGNELLEAFRDSVPKESAAVVFLLDCMKDFRIVDCGDDDLDALIRLSCGECMKVSVVGLNRAGSSDNPWFVGDNPGVWVSCQFDGRELEQVLFLQRRNIDLKPLFSIPYC